MRLSVVLLGLVGCTTPDKGPAPDPDAPDPADEAAWAELSARIEAQLADEEVPGMQVSVVLDGALAYTGGWGIRAYPEGDAAAEPVTPDTLFRWASVTKMHTAAAVLQLAEEGAVDLDAPITDHLDVSLAPGFDASALTARHLLTHTAALPDVLDWYCPTRDDALQTYVEDWHPPLYGPPGAFYNYSNSGYTWLGALLEVVDGATYDVVMHDRILGPSGMEGATLDGAAAAAVEDHATGNGWWAGEQYTYPLDEADCGPSRPAAWLHATAADLARTAEWQLAGGGDLLSEASVTAMHAQSDTHFWPDGAYEVGMGQFSFPYDDLDVVFHDGWVTGFVSAWAIVPGTGFGVAVVANADWADPYAVMYDALSLFLGANGDSWPEVATDPDTWDAYVGTYEDPYVFGTVDVTRDGGRLTAELVDTGETLRLTQVSGDYFWADSDDYGGLDVRFIQDESGAYTWFVTRPGVAARVDVAALAPEAAPPPASPDAGRAALRRYARPRVPGRPPLGLVGVPVGPR